MRWHFRQQQHVVPQVVAIRTLRLDGGGGGGEGSAGGGGARPLGLKPANLRLMESDRFLRSQVGYWMVT